MGGFADFLNQIASGTNEALSSPPVAGFQPPSIDPATTVSGLDPKTQEALTETPEEAVQKLFRQRYYHMQPGQENPTKKQRLQGFLESLVGAAAGEPPRLDQLRQQAMQQYQLQTGRLGQSIADERARNQLIGMQNRLGMQALQLASLDRNRQAMVAQKQQELNEKKREADLKNQVATIGNDLKKFNYVSEANLREKQGDLADVRKKILQFEADNPNLKPGQILEMMVGNSKDPGEALKQWQLYNMAKGIGSVTSSASTPFIDANGNVGTSRQSVRTKMFGGAAPSLPSAGGAFVNPRFGSGAGQAPAANPQAAPQAVGPQTAPQVTPQANPQAAAVTPGENKLDAEAKYADPLVPLPPGYIPQNKQILAARLKEKTALVNEARDMDISRNQALAAAQAIFDAVKSGRDKDFMGVLKGQPIWQKAVGMFGDRAPEQAFLSFLRPGMLLSTVRGNAGSSNRINQKEISMQDVGLGGNMLDKPENAIAGLLAHALHADTFGNQLRGSLPLDPDTETRATSANIAAIKRFMGELADYRKLSPAQKLVTPAPEMPKSIVEEMQGRSKAGRDLGRGRGSSAGTEPRPKVKILKIE